MGVSCCSWNSHEQHGSSMDGTTKMMGAP